MKLSPLKRRQLYTTSALSTALVLSMVSLAGLPTSADTMTDKEKNEPASAKAANINAAKHLNNSTAAAGASDKSKQASDKNQSGKSEQNARTAKAVNQIPGVKVSEKDLQTPQSTEIKGFHPIKKILQPVENLEGMSIKLEQQIVKLEGPIAALNPPMVSLQTKMNDVNGTMTRMQTQLNGVDGQMHGVRSDLARMREEIAQLKGPILAIQKPLKGVSEPLEAVERQLNLVLLAIVMAAIGVVIGTPIAAVLVYRFRDKLFPPDTANSLPDEPVRTPEKVLR